MIMGMLISDLLFQIRICLFTGSGLLLLGALSSLFLKKHYLEEGSVSPFSIQDRKKAPAPKAIAEKRRERRAQSMEILELKDESGKFAAGTAFLRDISPRGACFESLKVLRTGDLIEALLYSSQSGQLHISANVIWLRPTAKRILYGVKFNAVNPVRS